MAAAGARGVAPSATGGRNCDDKRRLMRQPPAGAPMAPRSRRGVSVIAARHLGGDRLRWWSPVAGRPGTTRALIRADKSYCCGGSLHSNLFLAFRHQRPALLNPSLGATVRWPEAAAHYHNSLQMTRLEQQAWAGAVVLRRNRNSFRWPAEPPVGAPLTAAVFGVSHAHWRSRRECGPPPQAAPDGPRRSSLVMLVD